VCEQPDGVGRAARARELDDPGPVRELAVEPLLAPKLLEHALKRLRCSLLGLEPAPLHALGTAPTNPISVRPLPPIPALRNERKHLPLLPVPRAVLIPRARTRA